MSTAGKVIVTVAVLPAASITVTVALLVLASAVFGVPLITPLFALMPSPGGRPVTLYPLIPLPPLGFMGLIKAPTCNDLGAL